MEAAYTLKASVPAGLYHVICDGIVVHPVDVRFDLIWRRGESDTILATWTQHWEPRPAGEFDAQPYELDVEAPAIDWREGDQLIFRYGDGNSTASAAFVPNGDGARKNGRIPNITLPK